MKISTILDNIDNGAMALPEFQRGYVWNRNQVRSFVRSLYLQHPVGSLLVWITRTECADARGEGRLQQGQVQLLLDGQQRITTLYGIVRGTPPEFFEGLPQAFTGLYFHVGQEIFEFYAPIKMRDDPLWVSVTDLIQRGLGDYIGKFPDRTDTQAILNRLNRICNIPNTDLHIDQISGGERTVAEVVDIFNKVNSGGTKLSQGDLALARMCASWPDARKEMNQRLAKWQRAGFHFRLEWLLRCITTLTTGSAFFSSLEDVSPEQFRKGLSRVESRIDYLLNLISSRLGLDHDRVLGSKYSFPLMVRYLETSGGRIHSHLERDSLLFWYVQTVLWGRYSGSTETVINQDIAVMERNADRVRGLIAHLQQQRGSLALRPDDFLGHTQGARFYPLLYMLTRIGRSRDWGSGLELSSHLLGSLSRLEVHHIFPKSLLRQHDYRQPEINALANFTFLTQETNLALSNRRPDEYLPEISARNPGVLESHWIPMDPALWRPENYLEFLAARRELLARAANSILGELERGSVPEVPESTSILGRVVVPSQEHQEAVDEDLVATGQEWVVQHGLPEGELNWEVIDERTGEPLVVLDLAWPNGLQEGLSQPVALLIDEAEETLDRANGAGFRYFTDLNSFQRYVDKEILGLQSDG